MTAQLLAGADFLTEEEEVVDVEVLARVMAVVAGVTKILAGVEILAGIAVLAGVKVSAGVP